MDSFFLPLFSTNSDYPKLTKLWMDGPSGINFETESWFYCITKDRKIKVVAKTYGWTSRIGGSRLGLGLGT